VVMEHHFRECASCRNDLEGARELAELFMTLPAVEPPHNFRAQVLSRVGESRRPVSRLQRWSLPLGNSRAPLAGLAAAALAIGLLFTAPSFHNVPTMGPNPTISLPGFSRGSIPVPGSPELLISGGSSNTPRPGEETVLNLIVQPSADLNNGRVLIPRMSGGITLLNSNVSTDRGRVLWQGSLQAGKAIRVPIRLRANRPGGHRVLLYVEGDRQSFQRLILVPVVQSEGPAPTDALEGDWSVTETMERLADRYGVIIVTDLSHERQQQTEIRPSLPRSALAQVAAQRGMQWTVLDDVYNLYR